MQLRAAAVALICTLVMVVPVASAAAQGNGKPSEDGGAPPENTGGAAYGEEPTIAPQITVPGEKAVLMDNGFAAAPELAPEAVKRAIWAANEIQDKPYRYGGGHQRFEDSGYDCSGTVSYALHAGGLLKRPLDSSSFMRWGRKGKGEWITVYTNPGHAYVVIAGLRLDTSSAGARVATARGPRWRDTGRPRRGFVARHPAGY